VGIGDRLRNIQEKAKASANASAAARADKQREADEQRAADEGRRAAEHQRWILGDELAAFDVHTAEEAKIAIEMARARKAEFQTAKRELRSDLADVREEWRSKTAGRISTTGLGRGTGGRIMRGAIQANRRSERMSHANRVNAFSDRRQEYDAAIRALDRLIAELKPMAALAGRSSASRATPTPAEDPTAVLARLADMRDRGLISADDYEAKKRDILQRL
jgi:Short C-terminal domain